MKFGYCVEVKFWVVINTVNVEKCGRLQKLV